MTKRFVLAAALTAALAGTARAQQVHGDLSGFLPSPTVAKVNGATPGGACPAHQWVSALSTSAVPTCSEPAAADISGLLTGDETYTGTPTFSNGTYSALFTGGYVGIGTTNPGATLEVNGSAKFDGAVTGIPGNLIGVQVFATSGTYTPDAGTNSVIVEGCGGGGSGAGAAASDATNHGSLGSGGGAGGYFKLRLTSGFSGVAVTIGAGGAAPSAGQNNGNPGGSTSFGSIVTAAGGTGGNAMGVGTGRANIGGAGGTVTVSSGTILVARQGEDGGKLFFTSSVGWSGEGASSPFGKGGQAVVNANAGSTQLSGNSGQGYCSGGGGALSSDNASGTAQPGGAGMPGIVIVWEFS